MKIKIIGDGSFGSFLKKELPNYGFEISDTARSVILAVPESVYSQIAILNRDRHLINVCSVQYKTTQSCLIATTEVTSIHPLFGARTPADKRTSLLTHECHSRAEASFLLKFGKFSKIIEEYTPEEHDKLMQKTHVAAVLAAKQAKPFIEAAKDIPDEHIPNSFRLLRQFVKTLDDMPAGTLSSIMSNPFI